MTDERVVYEVADDVAHVRMARPDKMNALDPAMFDALIAVGLEVKARDDVRAVVLSGEGRAFCAGLDFGQFAAMADGSRSTEAASLGEGLPPLGDAKVRAQQAVRVWSAIEAPVIAAVHGVAFGGGVQIALGADIRIVAPTARLAVMEVVWGLVPDMTGTQLLPELVGRDRAKLLSLTGREFSGAQAYEWGFATELADDPIAASLDLAREIAGHSRSSTRGIKKLIDMAGRVSLEEGLDAEQVVIRSLIGSDEQRDVVARRFASLQK